MNETTLPTPVTTEEVEPMPANLTEYEREVVRLLREIRNAIESLDANVCNTVYQEVSQLRDDVRNS